ncbi:hypothetical protein FACS1894189_5230 [Planctomycetales bacterium]|nr:hypothetical protein FACS1894189_5230 [Planctomycetales bacterium]
MIKTLTAYTYEVDDPKIAIAEILEQLQWEKNQRKNTVGIIHCSTDFLESGVVAAICYQLPFRTIGVTTLGFAFHDEVSEMALTVMVLTSDDVSFSIGLTEPINTPDEDILRRAYEKAAKKLPGDPALMISYFPLETAKAGAGGDFVIRSMYNIAPNVPVFGTMPIDNTHDFRDARILCDGNEYVDRFAFVLLQGENFRPRFYLGSVGKSRIREERAKVTKSEGNFLYSLNDTPILDYLKETLKLPFDQTDPSSVHMIPLIVDLNDGMPPFTRAMNSFTPENVAICSAEIPVGATIAVGRFGTGIILEETKDILSRILAKEAEAEGLLIYSCAARYWALGLDSLVEMELVRDILESSPIPYSLGYSCGELCPVQDETGGFANRLHNYTFIVCVW